MLIYTYTFFKRNILIVNEMQCLFIYFSNKFRTLRKPANFQYCVHELTFLEWGEKWQWSREVIEDSV